MPAAVNVDDGQSLWDMLAYLNLVGPNRHDDNRGGPLTKEGNRVFTG
jgi:hypothetical protein